MATSKPNPRPRKRATTQTIDEIEAQAAAILQQERDVMNDLAAWLRAAAVELPVESKIPVKFAKVANSIELYTGRNGTIPGLGTYKVDQAVEEWGREAIEDYADELQKWLGKGS
jgi:hypothetical protein